MAMSTPSHPDCKVLLLVWGTQDNFPPRQLYRAKLNLLSQMFKSFVPLFNYGVSGVSRVSGEETSESLGLILGGPLVDTWKKKKSLISSGETALLTLQIWTDGNAKHKGRWIDAPLFVEVW